jgi:hypothetical protein
MAQIDPSIAMGFRPIQIESPVNQMAAISQLQNAQQQQQMNALKMQEYERGLQSRNKLARIYADPTLKPGSPEQLLRIQQEVPDEYEGAATRALQRENILSQKEQREAEAEKRQFESKKLQNQLSKEQLNASLSELASYTSVDEARSALEQKVSAGALTREQADKLQQGLPADDAGMPAWQIRTMRGLLTPSEVLQDVRAEKKDAREAARLELEDARIRETQRHALAMEKIGQAGTDRAQLQLEETQRHNKAMENLRLREINKPPAGDNPNKVAQTTTDDNGNVTFYNAFGQVIRTEANAGKRSPNVIKAEQAEKNLGRDIERATKELADITKDGGLIDQSTGSGVGRIADIGARFVGTALEGDIASGKLKPIADMVLKMVPRFEGPQSDKDTQSYKEAAGQLADSSLPREIRKEAGKTILRLMKERKDQFAGEGMDISPNQRRAAPPPPANFVLDKK